MARRKSSKIIKNVRFQRSVRYFMFCISLPVIAITVFVLLKPSLLPLQKNSFGKKIKALVSPANNLSSGEPLYRINDYYYSKNYTNERITALKKYLYLGQKPGKESESAILNDIVDNEVLSLYMDNQKLLENPEYQHIILFELKRILAEIAIYDQIRKEYNDLKFKDELASPEAFYNKYKDVYDEKGISKEDALRSIAPAIITQKKKSLEYLYQVERSRLINQLYKSNKVEIYK